MDKIEKNLEFLIVLSLDGSGYVDHGIDFSDDEQHSTTSKARNLKKKGNKPN